VIWSQITIPGKPRVLMIDGTRNTQSWENEFSGRIFTVLKRKGLDLVGDVPLRPSQPQDLNAVLDCEDSFNCLFLLCHGKAADVPEETKLAAYWTSLSNRGTLKSKLLAVCSWETPDTETGQSILDARDSFAQIALVPGSTLSQRAAGLFYLKFFTELDLHADDSIMGKMVWFSHAKAKEILKRRNLPGEIKVCC
jgi:hypothetical protein